MIDRKDFKKGELESVIVKLESFHNDPANLHNEIVGYFA